MHEFEDYLEKSQSANSVCELWAGLQFEVMKVGFENLVFVQMHNSGHIEVPWRELPSGYDDVYVQNKWNQIDPVLQRTMKAVLPFKWEDIACSPELKRVQRRFLDDCRKLGVHNGFTVPIHAPGRRDIVSLSMRTGDKLEANRLPLVHMMVLQTWARHVALGECSSSQQNLVKLSERERACLRWIKDGKTYDDIAEILHISRKTVDGHLTSARFKLGATNTLTAVVKAIQLGVLDF